MRGRGAIPSADLGRSSDDSNERCIQDAALKVEVENVSVGTAVVHGLVGPKHRTRSLTPREGASQASDGEQSLSAKSLRPRVRRGKQVDILAPGFCAAVCRMGVIPARLYLWNCPLSPPGGLRPRPRMGYRARLEGKKVTRTAETRFGVSRLRAALADLRRRREARSP